jgi:hypothetical protein
MELIDFIQRFPGWTGFSRKTKILVFAYYLQKHRGLPEFSTTDLRGCFEAALHKKPSDLVRLVAGLSSGRNSPLIKGRKQGRYGLSFDGVTEVEGALAAKPSEPQSYDGFLKTALPYLKKLVHKVGDRNRREFLAEAISCLAVDARRAAVVMVWLVTIDHLYDYVLATMLADFNDALHKRSDAAAKLTVRAKDDFGELKESVFIETCKSAGIISKDVRKLLDEKLGIRNTCAHPGDVTIPESKVASFIEDLVDNVIVKYGLP